MQRWTWYLAAAGVAAAVAASIASPPAASSAAGQVWPAFVLVAGLLLIGLVAAEDGLFAAAGHRLAAVCHSRNLLFAGVCALVMVVTAVLNLDTSVAFLTPVVVHTGSRRRGGAALFVSACLLLSNAGSLLLPGSNLTNLIVLDGLHLPGGRFAGRMALPWLVAGAVTAAVVAIAGRRSLGARAGNEDDGEGEGPPADPAAPSRPGEADERSGTGETDGSDGPERIRWGMGLVAVVAAVVLILTLGNPAPEVAAVGIAAAGIRILQRSTTIKRAGEVLGLAVLTGLFGLAIGLGALGRDWAGPSRGLGHLGPWATAGLGGVSTVLINNLPAASLLSARPLAHPLALLVGLDLGPNLFVSGSLAWVLWYNAARIAGARPDVARTVRMGLVAAPLSMVAAVAALLVTGHS